MHNTGQRDRRHELVLSEPGNHRALEAILPSGFAQQIRLLYEGDLGFLMALSEKDLRKELRIRGFNPDKRDYILRNQFWQEYDSVQWTTGIVPQVNMSKVIRRAIPKEVFYKFYISDHLRLAWLLCPPQDYVDSMEALAFHALDKMHEILESPITDKRGNPNLATIAKMEKIFTSAHHKMMVMKGQIKPGEKVPKGKVKEVSEPTVQDLQPRAETPDEKLARLKAEREALQAEQKSSGIGREQVPKIE